MQREHLAAFIFPSTDPHNGEYVPQHWEGRKWISGFTGSAGTAVVTMHSAALWTDSRYFIAAADELQGTEYQLMKLKMAGTPSIAEWLEAEVMGNGCWMSGANGMHKQPSPNTQHPTPNSHQPSPYTEIGIDGMCCSASETEDLIAELRAHGGMTLRTNLDPLQEIWTDRPAIPLSPVEIQPVELTGESAHDKLARIRKALRAVHADGMLVAALDDIAWTLNIRAQDVHCTPVAVSYLLISSDKTNLYINKEKLSPNVISYLQAEGIATLGYADIKKDLQDYPDYNILMDPAEINYTLYHAVHDTHVISETSPIPAMKIMKSQAEIEGYRRAMLKDGIALVRFTRWLKEGAKKSLEQGLHNVIIDGEMQTEISIDRKLTALRAEQPLFRDISFDTIAGYGFHGAIIHYEATPDTDIPLEPHGMVLIDSGAQYQDGTTDITRTIPLGPLTAEMRLVYTLVLKGHIGLETVKFPDGACGTQLDCLARRDMWRYGYNYLHGTGHGVGSYLSVHEGPHQYRMEYKPQPLRAGMTITDEPGIYLEGKFGVRIENTCLIRDYLTPLEEQGETLSPTPHFLEIEALTLCPIDKEPIILDMLSKEEREWLNAYHKRVYDTLAPHLDEDDRAWLADACSDL